MNTVKVTFSKKSTTINFNTLCPFGNRKTKKTKEEYAEVQKVSAKSQTVCEFSFYNFAKKIKEALYT